MILNQALSTLWFEDEMALHGLMCRMLALQLVVLYWKVTKH